MPKNPKRPKDTNQLAKMIADIAAGEVDEINLEEEKNPAAVELGRKGGLKGGKARAEKLSAEQRREIARNAAQKRWENKKSES
jgi:hypothetical protein